MPFQPFSVGQIPTSNFDLVDSLTRGYKAGMLPAQMRQQRDMQQNQMQSQQFQNALRAAQTEKLQRESSLPFGGQTAPGAVGQAQWLDMIKQKYGPDSEIYKNASRSYEGDLKKADALSQYRDILGRTADKRTATPFSKLAQESEEIDQGFMPGTNGTVRLNPEQQNDLKGQIALKLQKEVSDTQTRQKVLNATNAEITMDRINPDALLQYSGPMGQAKLKRDQVLSAAGKTPEEYINYKRAVTNAQLWAKQLRQTYGDSIQPAMLEKLEKLSNPTTWFDDPKAARAAFDEFKGTVKQELKTFKGGLKSTNPYQERKEDSKPQRLKYDPVTGEFK